MKQKLFNIILIVFVIFTLVSCGRVENSNDSPSIDIEENPSGGENQGQTPPEGNEDKTEFVVSLIYNKRIYIPKADEIITVYWEDDYSIHSATIDSEGYAKIELDGFFRVYLGEAPKDYTYDPNIYNVDNDNPVIEIELLKISKVSNGQGTGLYKEYKLTNIGTYRTTVNSKTKKVYYEYAPREEGVYVVESLVNVYDDLVNPKLDVYYGTYAYKNFDETVDSGGTSIKGGYTKNFKWQIYISEQMIGNVYTFAIYADSKTEMYPVNIDFIIYKDDVKVSEVPEAIIMEAKELEYAKINEDYPSSKYTYVNSDGGIGNYYGGVTNGSGLLEGKNFKYNEETKVWHVYDPETDTFGPKLCAKITAPCAYYEESLNMIESHGNKNLTVSNSTENYKQFIEVSYASICNADGVCYVTMELMEFLQKFSVSQRLFFDGNGFVESTGVFAYEEDQWLFACGYYQENTKL